jgi:hypothetical protein|tara:strand:+ start:907 stop:1056 length:150 start_codon:yes stop_codon:yes gene_type:complete
MDVLKVLFWVLVAISAIWYFKDKDSPVFRWSSFFATLLIAYILIARIID